MSNVCILIIRFTCSILINYAPTFHLIKKHHWREGNLPTTSKCAACRKTCFSAECLTGLYAMLTMTISLHNNFLYHYYLGYRCEWCGITTHSACRTYVALECLFGMLQAIYLPPHAVSIPRTEVPMEAIIGVPVKLRSTPLQRDYSCRKYWQHFIYSIVEICFNFFRAKKIHSKTKYLTLYRVKLIPLKKYLNSNGSPQ